MTSKPLMILVNIKGTWVNPKKVTKILQYTDGSIVIVFGKGMSHTFRDITPAEVAAKLMGGDIQGGFLKKFSEMKAEMEVLKSSENEAHRELLVQMQLNSDLQDKISLLTTELEGKK